MDQIPARPASTIVVIRERNGVLEILMLRRSRDALAAASAHVFPGGGVDEADREVVRRGLVHGRSESAAAQRLGLDTGALEYYAAALRELFEEAGLLVATDEVGAPVTMAARDLIQWRRQLVARELAWPDLLASRGLRLDLGAVEYLAHWVTPTGRPHRFDTRFFVVVAPDGQDAMADDFEVDQVTWSTVARAVASFESGEWTLLPPTMHTLRALAAATSASQVIETAAHARVERIQPRMVQRGGVTVVALPGDADYGD
jgi:8-oxo-dGTP pyrophosphatase MutT (NUDIX family)